jgi:hypothetical protein
MQFAWIIRGRLRGMAVLGIAVVKGIGFMRRPPPRSRKL